MVGPVVGWDFRGEYWFGPIDINFIEINGCSLGRTQGGGATECS